MTSQQNAATILKEIDECLGQLISMLAKHKLIAKFDQARLDPNNPGAVSELDSEAYGESYEKCDELRKKFDELSREYLAASK